MSYLQGLSEARVESSQAASQRAGAHKKYFRICEVARKQKFHGFVLLNM